MTTSHVPKFKLDLIHTEVPVVNALTVDVEDYFQVAAFRSRIRVEDWDRYPLRVEQNTHRVLDRLEAAGVHGTFFVLGWVAERLPQLVREICGRGHEIASHGYDHQLLYEIGPTVFRNDVRRSKAMLEDLCGKAVLGYRAPSYSITAKSLWALDILVEEGFLYDSSIYPIVHDLYGIPGAERFPHRLSRKGGMLHEFPISTMELRMGSVRYRLPVGGGGYLRLLPIRLVRYAISTINQRERRPAVLYFHPWELDLDQPRVEAPWRSRFRHYHNIDRMEDKIQILLENFAFAPMSRVLELPEENMEPLLRPAGQA